MKWPRCFGRYEQASKAFYAKSLQDNPRFYVTEEEGTWLLMLSRW